MRIVLLGPPGVGKGSLALWCEQRLGLPHLSAGEIFRQGIARNSRVGAVVRRYVTRGLLVPDALVVRVMASHLRKTATTKGFVLDGFPRTWRQAEGLDRVLSRWRTRLDGAVVLKAPQRLLVQRLSGRRVCERCGANYHVRTMRPRRANRCDRCRGRLTRRKDDDPDTVTKRLAVDRAAARPLLDYYRRRRLLYELDGRGRPAMVFGRAVRLFRRQGWLTGGSPWAHTRGGW